MTKLIATCALLMLVVTTSFLLGTSAAQTQTSSKRIGETYEVKRYGNAIILKTPRRKAPNKEQLGILIAWADSLRRESIMKSGLEGTFTCYGFASIKDADVRDEQFAAKRPQVCADTLRTKGFDAKVDSIPYPGVGFFRGTVVKYDAPAISTDEWARERVQAFQTFADSTRKDLRLMRMVIDSLQRELYPWQKLSAAILRAETAVPPLIPHKSAGPRSWIFSLGGYGFYSAERLRFGGCAELAKFFNPIVAGVTIGGGPEQDDADDPQFLLQGRFGLDWLYATGGALWEVASLSRGESSRRFSFVGIGTEARLFSKVYGSANIFTVARHELQAPQKKHDYALGGLGMLLYRF